MEFVGCEGYTVGAEWELQLIDRSSLDLAPGIETLVAEFAGNRYVKPELVQSCVELNTPITRSSAEVGDFLRKLSADIIRRCRANGMDLVGAGTHPFCRRLALITPLPRYETAIEEHGYLAQTQLAFATHIHVGVASGDEAIRTMRLLTPCLPLLIAIAANSPFWRNHDTGYASYRRRLLAASRSYGLPPYFDDWEAFRDFYRMACRAGSFKTIKDIHWDMRPHPDFGTLEVRVMDSQPTATDVSFIAGLVRILVAWIGASSVDEVERVIPRRLSHWVDRENHFRASHWGLDATLIHDLAGKTRPLADYLTDLAAEIESIASDLNEADIVRQLGEPQGLRAGYVIQKQAYVTAGDTAAVTAVLRDRLAADSGVPAKATFRD